MIIFALSTDHLLFFAKNGWMGCAGTSFVWKICTISTTKLFFQSSDPMACSMALPYILYSVFVTHRNTHPNIRMLRTVFDTVCFLLSVTTAQRFSPVSFLCERIRGFYTTFVSSAKLFFNFHFYQRSRSNELYFRIKTKRRSIQPYIVLRLLNERLIE